MPKVLTPGVRKNLGDLALPRKRVLDRVLDGGGSIELVDGEVSEAGFVKEYMNKNPKSKLNIADSAGVAIGRMAAVGTMPGKSASSGLHELGHIYQDVTFDENPGKYKELSDVTERSAAQGWIDRLVRDPRKYYRIVTDLDGKKRIKLKADADEEWFAELLALYHRQPGRLRRVSMELFDFMDRHLAQ